MAFIDDEKKLKMLELIDTTMEKKKKKRSPKWTFLEEIKEEVLEAQQKGLTTEDIIRVIYSAFGIKVSTTTVYSFLKYYNPKPDKKKKKEEQKH